MPTATLTRIHLNRRHRAARTDLADAVSLHKTLMRLVPDHLGPHPRARAHLLHRLETGPDPFLLVQTTYLPDLTALPPGYGTAHSHDLTPMLRALRPGLPVRYRITAAPTASRIADAVPHPTTGRRRGKTISLQGEAALAWWQRRATAAGLEVTTSWAAPRPFPRSSQDRPAVHHTLTQFDGTALITDPHALTTAVLNGIGKGKPYGAGLLSLAPA
ncbi:type I-E CRISPR-associated protein Cas6/Cse3/CasE [Streptomyces luteireticuli]|uniref:Type I-E CRISPR-associated protein Cas6/Cse3/CasE n=1 Tax=Streptomyces luteireticuli TaxID=173858 RepID=A0ABN0ZA08_9ACTN